MIEEKKIEVDGFVTSDGSEFVSESNAKRHEQWLATIRQIQMSLDSIPLSDVISTIKDNKDEFHDILITMESTSRLEKIDQIVDFVEKEQGINKD